MDIFTGESALDNPVWSCLTTRHAQLAQGGSLARRYPAEFSPLSGTSATAQQNIDALHALVGAGDDISMTRAIDDTVPPNWEVQHCIQITQMIRRERALLEQPLLAQPHGDISQLSAADVDDMLALVDLTHPGPFRRRTVELGAFVGIREHGRLLAMAGERMWVGDYREVSGVCTHPEAQKRGLARTLIGCVVNRMLRAGQTPFLHVASANAAAIAVYTRLGFVRRTEFMLVHAKRLR